MTELASEELETIARELRATPHLLLCLDFDGTLAPIVEDPARARIPETTKQVLAALSRRADMTLAIVSGRSVSDLRTRIEFEMILAGNHGLEVAGNRYDLRNPQSSQWQRMLREICRELRPRVREIPGALLEDKGLTASVHYRNVSDADVPAVEAMVNAATEPKAGQFRVRHGKKVLEILPRVHWNKGSAIRWIERRLRDEKGHEIGVCYIGDDATDELAFRELGPGAITIRVGYDCPTAARFRVRGVREVCGFLRWLGEQR